jgi:type IV pilus assembly protein PilZ
MEQVSTASGVELRVNYKRLNTFFADYAKSISRGGTFVPTKRPLGVGTQFQFVLGVPKLEAPLVLGGKVTRVTETARATEQNPAGMLVELEYESDAEREEIRSIVETLMTDELGPTLTHALLSLT